MLAAGAGQDLLIGGLGGDRLVGGADGDILVGGATIYDSVDAALRAILDEWTSADNYDDGVMKLQIGVAAPDGVPFDSLALNETTVMDLAADDLTGSAGQDWFLSLLSADITDRKPNETVD
jgi:hypothetical protein